MRCATRRPASADRTARRQFQATGQPVNRTQASDAMTSRLPRYEAKCVQQFLGDRLQNGSPYAIGPLSVCPVMSVLSVCNVRALWPNGWTDQDETWQAGRPQPWPHCVRWGPSSPPPKGHSPPNFRPISVAAKRLHRSRCHLVWS